MSERFEKLLYDVILAHVTVGSKRKELITKNEAALRTYVTALEQELADEKAGRPLLAKATDANVQETISCQWREDTDGFWEATCGLAWIFTDYGPAENDVNFCPKCGRKVEIIPMPELADEEAPHANET